MRQYIYQLLSESGESSSSSHRKIKRSKRVFLHAIIFWKPHTRGMNDVANFSLPDTYEIYKSNSLWSYVLQCSLRKINKKINTLLFQEKRGFFLSVKRGFYRLCFHRSWNLKKKMKTDKDQNNIETFKHSSKYINPNQEEL